MKPYRLIFAAACLAFLLAPVLTLAAGYESVSPPFWGPILSCTGNFKAAAEGGGLKACASLCDAVDTLNRLIQFIITLVIFIIAPIMFLVGAVMIMLSRGADMLSEGKKIMFGTAIGLALVLGAWVIVSTMLWLIGNPKSGTRVSWPNIQCDATTVPIGNLNLKDLNSTAPQSAKPGTPR